MKIDSKFGSKNKAYRYETEPLNDKIGLFRLFLMVNVNLNTVSDMGKSYGMTFRNIELYLYRHKVVRVIKD